MTARGALAIVLAGACGPALKVPLTDATKPTVKMSVSGAPSGVISVGETDVKALLDAEAALSAIAVGFDEDGGVKSVEITGTAVTTCASTENPPKSPIKRDWGLGNKNASTASVGDAAVPQRATAVKIDLPGMLAGCPEGFVPRTLSGSVFAKATNFHGGTAFTGSFNFEACGRQGQPACSDGKCKPGWYLNWSDSANAHVCDNGCGELYEGACVERIRIDSGSYRDRWTCYNKTEIQSLGPQMHGTCACIPSRDGAESDVSDESGACVSGKKGSMQSPEE